MWRPAAAAACSLRRAAEGVPGEQVHRAVPVRGGAPPPSILHVGGWGVEGYPVFQKTCCDRRRVGRFLPVVLCACIQYAYSRVQIKLYF